MKISLRLSDGREAVDRLAQVTVVNAHGDPVMVAYHGPAGAIVCGHVREDGWVQFLEDNGLTDRLQLHRAGRMFARVVPIGGTVSVVPTLRCVVYSDHGDPVIAAVLGDNIDTVHAGDRDWHTFCEQHQIYIPRAVKVQDLN